jgi:hypothetical protein
VTDLITYVRSQLAPLCPIDGLSLPSATDPTSWRVTPNAAATPAQLAAVQTWIGGQGALAIGQAAKIQAAEAQQAALIAAGFTFQGHLYQIDQDSLFNINAMGGLALGSITNAPTSPWPAGFVWIAADNSKIPMDAPTCYAFSRAVGGYVSALVLRLRALKDAITVATTQAALDAIDVTASWPAAGV